jgi:hypothetical protein
MSIDTGRKVLVKVLENSEVTPRPDLVGQWLDDRHYHTLVNYDMDLYLPPSCAMDMTNNDCSKECGNCESALNEKNIVFKFRRNYFDDEMVKSAYEGLRDAAQETQNRGTAAGPREGKLGNREWVTSYQWDVLDAFRKGGSNIFNEDPVDAIREKYKDNKADIPSNRAQVWSIERVRDAAFDFDKWVEHVRTMSPAERADEAEWVESDLICKTTYANSVLSGIAGWYDRYPRIPFGRATSYTEQNPEKFAKSYPYLQHLGAAFKEMLPWRYGNQMEAASKVDKRFLVPDTPFSTITVNRNFRTAAHYDPANMENGFANICVFSNSDNYSGAYLVFPEIGYAIDIRPGDLLFVNNMAGLHGNTELVLDDPNAERISIIAFFHEGMLTLGSWEYEQTRKKYVEFCKHDTTSPHYRPRFNGVYPGMWESKEWYDFCEKELGRAELLKMHPEAEEGQSLEEFFG